MKWIFLMTQVTQVKKARFVLYHEKDTDNATIEIQLRRHRGAEVDRVNTLTEILDRVVSGGIDSLLCNVHTVDVTFATFIRKVRSLESSVVIIIVHGLIDQKAFDIMKRLTGVILLESPAHPGTINLLCKKIIEGHDVRQRRHKRFLVDQEAVLEKINQSASLNVHVFNISRGGAYIECEASSVIKPKDIIKLTIKLDKLGKTREVHGKVRWLASFTAIESQKLGFGVEFINSDELYFMRPQIP